VSVRVRFHFADEPLVMEGGHAINIVGWSDTYRTEHGEVGGFIVRNTWADGLGTAHGLKARGSHTAAYFHGEVYGGHSPSFNLPKIWLGEVDGGTGSYAVGVLTPPLWTCVRSPTSTRPSTAPTRTLLARGSRSIRLPPAAHR